MNSDECGIAWSFDTLPETITQFNQEVSSIHAGNSTLHKKSGADYQDPTGMVLFTSRMQAVYIIPDEICNNLLMATPFMRAIQKSRWHMISLKDSIRKCGSINLTLEFFQKTCFMYD